MLNFRVNAAGFERLRTLNQALSLTEGDRDRLIITFDSVARRAALQGIRSRGQGAWAPLQPRYQRWKARAGFGRRMMVLSKAYRGREPEQLLRKFTRASHSGHIARRTGPLRYAFGASDDVAFKHEQGAGLPRRSVIDSIYLAREDFIRAFVAFWNGRVGQALRHA